MLHSMHLKKAFREPVGKLSVKIAKANNLRNFDVDIPTGVLTVVVISLLPQFADTT